MCKCTYARPRTHVPRVDSILVDRSPSFPVPPAPWPPLHPACALPDSRASPFFPCERVPALSIHRVLEYWVLIDLTSLIRDSQAAPVIRFTAGYRRMCRDYRTFVNVQRQFLIAEGPNS